MLYELACWKSILQPGEKKKSLKYCCLEVLRVENNSALQVTILFCINLCMTEDICLPNQLRWFNFIAADTIFSFSVFCMGLVQESCVLFYIKLLSLNFRELPK